MNTEVALRMCKNCGSNFKENFCSRCGQKEVHRITIPHVLHDMIHVFLHADKCIFVYIKRLLYQPGYIAREYIDGKRKIFNPFQYLLFSIAFIIFIMAQIGFYKTMQTSYSETSAAMPSVAKKAMTDFGWFLERYSNLIYFGTLPIYALFSWLVFKKRIENYAEHFTMMVFTMSQVNTLNAIFLIALYFAKANMLTSSLYSMILLLACFTITYKQFYSFKWLKAFWKAIMVFALSYLVQMIIMCIGLIIYIAIISQR